MKFFKGNTAAKSSGSTYSAFAKRRNQTILFCVVILVVFFFIYRSTTTTTVYVVPGDESLSIQGRSKEELIVRYSDIISVELTDSVDFGEVAGGVDSRASTDGIWHNDKWGDYYLIILHKAKKYIILTTQTNVIVFNYESTSTTQAFFDEFQNYMNQLGFADHITFTNTISD